MACNSPSFVCTVAPSLCGTGHFGKRPCARGNQNKPLGMYALKPILDLNLQVDLPKCMYTLPNIQSHLFESGKDQVRTVPEFFAFNFSWNFIPVIKCCQKLLLLSHVALKILYFCVSALFRNVRWSSVFVNC